MSQSSSIPIFVLIFVDEVQDKDQDEDYDKDACERVCGDQKGAEKMRYVEDGGIRMKDTRASKCTAWGVVFGASAWLAATSSAYVTNMVAELEEDHELPMAFETPHTDWAQPYAQGTVRVLYFGYGGSGRGIEARDFVELMQRFEVQGEAAFFQRPSDTTFHTWVGGPAGIARIDRLLAGEWDCYLFNGVSPDLMPVYRYIRDRFTPAYYGQDPPADGAKKPGIVFIGVDDSFLTRSSLRVGGSPPPVPGGEAFESAHGRAVRLPPRPKIPFHPGWEVEYDHWMEKVGRSVLWAAGREPRVDLRIEAPETPVARDRLDAAAVAVRPLGRPVGENLELRARLRNVRGEFVELPVPESAGPGGEYVVALTHSLAAGPYTLEVFASSDRGAEGWATAPLEVSASRWVEQVSLGRDWDEVGGVIAGLVMLAGPSLPDEQVVVHLVDAHGRVLALKPAGIMNSTASFSFVVEPWMPMLVEVRAVLTAANREVASRGTYFRVTKRQRGQFNFVVWTAGGAFAAADWPYDTLAPYAMRQLARLGCTGQMIGSRSAWRGWPYLPAAAAEIALVPYATRFTAQYDEQGYMLPACWNHEPAVNDWAADVVRQSQSTRQHGALVYSLGDEGVNAGSCLHPACVDAYRGFLEQEYDDIGALNASWGSTYATFAKVDLLVPGDNLEEEALRRGMIPRWFDRQAFRAQNLVHLAARFAGTFRTIDPEARSGYEGSGRFADGADIDLICRELEYWAPYPGLQDEVLRSIAPPGFIMSNWMGYYKSRGALLGQYWRMVTRGFDSVWFWRWDGLGPYEKTPPYHGLLNAALAPWRAVQEMQEDTQIVRDGLGTLLMQSEREHDGIAMLYSFPSQFAIAAGPGTTYGDAQGHQMHPLKHDPDRDGKESLIVYEQNHMAWHRALRAVGLQFEYVTDRMLRNGEFASGEYKVLILSQIEALSPGEAAAIRAFAEKGGTVLADVRPGLSDGHCRPLETGLLDDLFGIRRTGNLPAQVAPARIEGRLGDTDVSLAFNDARVDPGVETAAGEGLGQADGVPLCILNQAGQGRTVLLNLAMDSFPLINRADGPADADTFILALLRAAGVEPRIGLTDETGHPVRDTEIIRWSGPGVEYLALFGAMDLSDRRMMYVAKDETVTVTLPEARHVYDLRGGVYRGVAERFSAAKLGNRATFFVLSERELAPCVLRLSKEMWPRGSRAMVEFSHPGSDATHAARLRVLHPDGVHADWYDRVILVPPGGARALLPIAHNDPPGTWMLTATDLYTGAATKMRMTLR